MTKPFTLTAATPQEIVMLGYKLLRAISLVAPEPMPREVLELFANDSNNFDKALKLCKDMGVLLHSPETNTYTITDIAREFCKIPQVLIDKEDLTLDWIKALKALFINHKKELAQFCPMMIVHVEALILNLKRNKTVEDQPNIAELTKLLGAYNHLIKRYDKALAACEESLAAYVTLYGEKSVKAADIYNNIAVIYKAQKDYNKAIELTQKALFIKTKELGEFDTAVASLHTNTAQIHTAQGNYDQANESYKQALEIYLRKGDEKKVDKCCIKILATQELKSQKAQSSSTPTDVTGVEFPNISRLAKGLQSSERGITNS